MREGHISGRVSADGLFYELVQFGKVRQSIPLTEVEQKMKSAIRRNKWGSLP